MTTWLGTLAKDLRHGVRLLGKTPGFTFVAVLMLGLGVGANTAVFSLVFAVLLRPFPFKDPGRLTMIWEQIPKRGVNRVRLCAANFSDIESQADVFDHIAAMTGGAFTLSSDGNAEQVFGARVSPWFFEILGVAPELGRPIAPQDSEAQAADAVVISHELWQRRFNSNPAMLGKVIQIEDHPYNVIGIMPPGFHGLFHDHDLWIPLRLTPEAWNNRRSHYLTVFGRLRRGIEPGQAKAEIDTIAARLERANPDTNKGRSLRIVSMLDDLVGGLRAQLLIITAAVCLVLLVACVNVANLLVARAVARQREISIRAALGASRSRVLQQLMTEALLLASLGAVAGLGVAKATLRLLALAIPATLDVSVPGLDRVAINGPVLVFTLLTTVIVSVLFGLVPALHIMRSSAGGGLRGRGAGGALDLRGRYARKALLAIEVAFSLLLVIGAGLLLRSFRNLMEVDLGFNSERVLTASVLLSDKRYKTDSQQIRFFEDVLQQLRSAPGVASAAAIDYLPLSGGSVTRRLLIEGRPRFAAGEEPAVDRRIVTIDYFKTLGIPIRSGRVFEPADTAKSPMVVVINEAMRRQYWNNESPIGGRIHLGVQGNLDSSPVFEIVGVVGDVRETGPKQNAVPEAYVPLSQQASAVMALVVRSAGFDPRRLSSSVRESVAAFDKRQALMSVAPMTEVVSDSFWQPRLNTTIIAAFAVLALALAVSGIYGVTAQITSQRNAEIGIRMALGARRTEILRLVLWDGLSPVAAGIFLGLLASFAVSRLISSQLYGVRAGDTVTLLGALALIIASALIATLRPAWQAARVDPLVALRYE
jgi:putative ABC transport system permease protein